MSKQRLAPVVWLLLVAAGGALLIARGRISTDLTLFMPAPTTPAEQLLLDQLREGPAARALLIALEGSDPARRASVSRALAEELRQTSLFNRVANGDTGLGPERDEFLFRYRYLLDARSKSEMFGSESLRSALEARLRELASPLSTLEKHNLPVDPTAAFRAVLQTWRPASEPPKPDGVWTSPDGDRTLLLAETRAPGYEMEAQAQVLETIRQRFRAANPDPALRLLISGPAVFAVDARRTIRADAQRLSLVASLFLLAFLGLVYRSPRVLLLCALPLATGVLAAAAAVTAVFGVVHGITLAFGITLLGVALDYPLHLFSHAHRGESLQATVQGIWPTLRLGVLTTVMGYVAMGWTDFGGIAQLGLFAATGLLAAAACARWVLPGVFLSGWVPAYDTARARWTEPLNRSSALAAWLLSLTALAALVVLFASRAWMWERDLAALSPVPAAQRLLDRELRAQIGAPDVRHAVLITAPDAETVLVRGEALIPRLEELAAAGVMDGFDIAARYLPSETTQRARQAVLPGASGLARRLQDAVAGLPFKRGLFEPFIAAVDESKRLAPLTPADVEGTALGLRMSPLLYRRGSGWVGVVPLLAVHDEAALAAALEGDRPPGVHYIDLKRASGAAVNAFRDGALARLAWAAPIVVLVLFAGLRSARRVLAVSVSLGVALAVDIALLVGLGERISLFHLMALLLVVGIGIDYGLFFSLPQADASTLKRTHHALSVCAISTVSVFGILSFSDIPILRAVGGTVAIGVLATFIAATVFAQRWREPTPSGA